TKTYQHTGTYSKRGSSIPFYIGIFVIILVGVFLVSILTDTNMDFLNFTKKKTPKINKILFAGTNIIERNYDIPVSFTSDKNYINLFKKSPKVRPVRKPPIRKTTAKKTSKRFTARKRKVPVVPLQPGRIKVLRESMNDVVNATKNKEMNLPPQKENKNAVDLNDQFTFENLPSPIDTVKLRSNIYRDGNTFIVQVSSWKSQTTAEKEAAKFKIKGFDAFVAKALIPGKGFWYRVRVRNFKTLKKAENFLLLYQ
ncbi:MAG TPA: SPOR domain-containing protein, partial [Ignavibacteria bacterium]|nr:SPOR domain-containing protein [Ignavibacteria bacterium]